MEGDEGESVRSNQEKKSMNSDECRFAGWMLNSPWTTSGVPSSGEQPSWASVSSKKSQRRPGE